MRKHWRSLAFLLGPVMVVSSFFPFVPPRPLSTHLSLPSTSLQPNIDLLRSLDTFISCLYSFADNFVHPRPSSLSQFGWFVTAALIYGIIPGLSFLSALVIAACVTPTDPVSSTTPPVENETSPVLRSSDRDLAGT